METATPSRPSSVVKDLNPVIERVILRCLENEPSARPANVFSVAAALPGGDPLAAALAAGETPSPQLVAASGESAGLRPRIAVICLAAVLLGLALVTYFSIHYSALEKMGLEQTPEVLTQKSREIIARLGYGGRPADSAFGLRYDGDFQDYVEKNDKPPHWDAVLACAAFPAPILVPAESRCSGGERFPRQSDDARDRHQKRSADRALGHDQSGARSAGPIDLLSGDPAAKTTRIEAVESQPAAPFDWNVLFTAAGLDPSQFQPAQPIWNSLAASDMRMAWTGNWPGTARPLRVEAAAFQGKPVFFSLIGDWTKPERMKSTEKKSVGAAGQTRLSDCRVLCRCWRAPCFLRAGTTARDAATGRARFAWAW